MASGPTSSSKSNMSIIDGQKWAWVYAVIGVLVAMAAVYHVLTEEPRTPFFHVFSYVFVSFTASGVIVYGANRHYRDPLPSYRYWRLNIWLVGGAAFIVAIGVVSLYIGSQFITTNEFVESSQLMAGVGLAIGFVIGSFEAWSLENAEAAARAETLEAERERLALLNELLRHYVLNGASVIGGFAERLESSPTREQPDAATVIKDRAEDMANIVDNIGVLTRTEWGDGNEVEADIGAEIREHFSTFGEDDMTLDVADDLPSMVANVGYEQALALFMEACCEATGPGGAISVEGNEQRGNISITARPVDIPDSQRKDLLEPVASGIGLQLYLAKKVLEPAIELELSEDGEETIEFVLRGMVGEDGE